MTRAARLRPLTAQDLVAAAALHARCFPDQAWDAKALGDLLNSPGVAGFLAVSASQTLEALLLLRAIADEAEVLTICVAPESRGVGLGRDLLRAGLSLLAEGAVRRVFLEVAEDNAAALALYQSEGFERIAERRNYYQRAKTQVTALVMEKLLQ